MKLPSFDTFVKEYKKQVTDAVMGCVHIDETSFGNHNATITATKLKLEEYASPQLLLSVDVENTNKCYGFSIQCLCKDEAGELIDAPDTFVDLEEGAASGLQYASIYLPNELETVESIEVSLIRPIYETKNPEVGAE